MTGRVGKRQPQRSGQLRHRTSASAAAFRIRESSASCMRSSSRSTCSEQSISHLQKREILKSYVPFVSTQVVITFTKLIPPKFPSTALQLLSRSGRTLRLTKILLTLFVMPSPIPRNTAAFPPQRLLTCEGKVLLSSIRLWPFQSRVRHELPGDMDRRIRPES